MAVARGLAFIRETDGPNRGAWVSMLQRFCGGIDGESWCADFVSYVLDVAYHGRVPILRTGSCQRMLSDARVKGFAVAGAPLAEDLYFYVNASGLAHHVGIVTATAPLTGIAGNTSADGLSSDGTGVFEHVIAASVFVRLP